MSVKLLDNDAFYGYRVRRTVDAKLFQEYFSLKKNGKRLTGAARKRVQGSAERRDRQLAAEQVQAKKANKAQRCFNDKGAVRGISYLVKTEKSGSKTPIFQVGIASETDGKIICTSYSINAHGKTTAWAMAVATYAKHKGISKGSKLYKQLLAAIPKRAANPKTKSGKKAAKKKAAGKKVARKKQASRSSKKSAKKTAKKSAKKSTKKKSAKRKTVKKKTAKKAVKKTGRKASKKPAKKTAKKVVKKAGKKKAAKKAAKR